MICIKIIKHLGNTFFVTVILLLSSIPSLADPLIKAGAARENITPPLGTIINGNFLPYYAKTIYDRLYAKALAFDNGKQRFVFVVVDCMSMDGALIRDVKKLIKQKLGLLSAQIMILSTHAHSCGAVRGGSICPADLAYRLAIFEKVTKTIKNGITNLQPAKFAWGHIDVPQHPSCIRCFMTPGFNIISIFGYTDRGWMNPPMGSSFLDKSAAPTNPQVSYLAVKNLKDQWISILANYFICYASDVPDHVISADYFGEVYQQLQVELNAGDNFVGIMSNGTSGDVNTFDFKQERNYSDKPDAKSNLIANDVSDSIIYSLRTASFHGG